MHPNHPHVILESLFDPVIGLDSPGPIHQVEIEDVLLSYPGALATNGGFSLGIGHMTISSGGIHSIYGTNGCGKTTLLRALAGIEQAKKGTLRWTNPYYDRPSPGHTNSLSSIMLATQAGPMPHWTVRENILLPIKNRQSERSSDPEERTAALIGLLGLDGLENRYPHQLSAGQQQRTVLARALGIDPGILLLDEIMSGQSEFWSAKIASILKHFAATGRMVVIVCHDPEWVAAHAHWVAHIVSDATDAVATTRFFVGFDGNTSEWQAFRKQRLVSIHDKDTHN